MENFEQYPYSVVYTVGRMMKAPSEPGAGALLQSKRFKTEEEAKTFAREIESKRHHAVNFVKRDGKPWLENRLAVLDWLCEK